MAGKNPIFTNEFIKKLKKTNKTHAQLTNDTKELKQAFKKCFDNPTLGTLINILMKYAHEDDKKKIRNFKTKVDSGNFDDVDLNFFKEIVDTYLEQIMNELENNNDEELGFSEG